MKIVRFAIQRKTLMVMLFIAATMLGYISYTRLPVELLPSTELPFLIVQASSIQDMDPKYIEKKAIVPLEGAISSLEGIDRIESFVERRSGRIMVYFNPNVRIKYVHLKLQERINAIKSTLGEEFVVGVFKVDTQQLSNMFMRLQVRGTGGVDRIRNIVDRKILRDLENLDGIARVEVFGGQQETVEIILNEDACKAHRITASQIRGVISRNNRNKTFVGQVYEKNRRYFVNLTAEFDDVHQLENIILKPVGPVLLKDVARVYFGVKERTSISRVNGKESVTLQMIRDTQVNMISLSHAARAVVADLNHRLKSEGLDLVIQSDSAEEIEKNIDLIKELALTGGLLAIVILWIFLRNLRMLFVISLTIPVSILMSLNIFYGYEISLNSLTLVGIALAVGMLVDNSVVVLENIYRLLAAGYDRDRAVVQGSSEVWKSVFASTLTTIIVFLPFMFSENFFLKILGKHVGISIVATLLMSLVVAMLLIPLMIHALIRTGMGENRLNFTYISSKNRLVQLYTLLLKSAMRFPARTIMSTAVAFFASLLICLGLSLNVPSEVELKEFPLYVTMPRGATLQTTDLVVMDLEKLLNDIPEKEEVVSEVFEEEATLTVRLQDGFKKIRRFDPAQVKGDIQRRIDHFRAADVSFERPRSSRRFGEGGGNRSMDAGLERLLGIGSQEEKVVIKGADFDLMLSVAKEVRSYLEDLANIQRVNLSVSENRPEIHVLLDNQILSESNLTANSIAGELASFQSEYSTNLRYKQGVDEYDIIIRNEKLVEKTMDDLRELRIPDESGGLHDLQEVSRIIYSQGASGINRVNQEKVIEVSYRFQTDVTGDKDLLEVARAEVDQVVAGLRLPSGLVAEVIHDDPDLSEFYFLISAAFILIYMVMASVFESLWMPVVMMFTLPLAAIGSLWALIFTGNSILNANALIGFLILLGVVVNNGIIFIDFANLLRKRGFRRSRSLVLAGRARVRPILITSFTTIIGMLPLAMGKAEYVTRIGSPFAIAMIGGLSLSTVFTLIFIPTVYSGLENTMTWFRGLTRSVRWLQISSFVAGAIWIHYNVDSMIWKFVDLFAWLALIPSLVYFVQSSLRRSQAKYIGANEPITIRVQHLVKIYDEDSRFVREWKRGRTINASGRQSKALSSRELMESFIWQIPFCGFLIYFVFFYLENYFWVFLFNQALFFLTMYLYKTAEEKFLLPHYGAIHARLRRILKAAFVWGYPLITLTAFYLKWKNPLTTAFVAVIWYFLLLIYTTGQKLDRDQINIARVIGRFSGLRRSLYRFVRLIPIIGRHKQPFKALDNVTLEIGSGMFGLLGPNGAGKTTLMRIICGILEQSRGTIWINGISLKEKREELQGLIGYLPQEFGAYENMTAYEFLSYQSILKGIYDKKQREQRIDYVLGAVHLDSQRNQKIGSFSGGMKQRMGIAQTLLHLPRILVVDEPTAGLDPRERIRFRNLLVELSRERVVIFSTHIIEDISSSCSHVAVLNKGRLFYNGEPNKMVDIAVGKIWQFLMDPVEFDRFQASHQIVHHIRVDEHIRVRCLSETRPHPSAETVRPTLEDAYLTLLRYKE